MTHALPPFPSEDGKAHEAAAPGRLDGLSILAAEDEPVNQWVLEELLKQEGARCRIVDDGPAALAALRSGEPCDVFLTDIQMPGLNGYDTARQALALRPGLPVIGLTASALPAERQRCLDAGMRDQVTKPVDMDVLTAVILGTLPSRAPDPSPLTNEGEEPPLDWDGLRDTIPRAASRQRILETLLVHHGETPGLLHQLLAAGEAEALRQLAHKVRGVAGMLCAGPTKRAAEDLENAILARRVADPALTRRLMRDLESLLNEARCGLADLPATKPHGNGG